MTETKGKPRTVQDVLEAWDRGDVIWSIEMGGMGPGYEQAIQITFIAILRALDGRALPDPGPALEDLFDEACRSSPCLDGLTGAQAGAAKSLAYQFLTRGPGPVLADVPADRRIMVSKHWPKGVEFSA